MGGVNNVLTQIEYSGSSQIVRKSWRIGILMNKCGFHIPYHQMVDTLLHELAHCYHENHSNDFYTEWNQLRSLYRLYTKERRRKFIQKFIPQKLMELRKWLPRIVPVVIGGVIMLRKAIITRKKSKKMTRSKLFPLIRRVIPWKHQIK